MWIRIDRMRIRIKDNKITNLISTHLLKVKKKKYFQICTLDLKKYNFYKKNPRKFCWLNSVFSFIIYLWILIRIWNADPDPHHCESCWSIL